jgi:SGNH hydrolase-like domain, acetyltransferase AlgX
MFLTRLRTVLPAPRRVFALIVILAVEFAVLEAGLRVRGGTEASPAFQQLFMDDAVVGHRLRPNARARYTTVEFSTDLAINAQGVRDDADIGPKAPDERRVVVLGDSLVLSVQVPLAETFCKRLEARLNAADDRHHWRVINAGVQGYGPVDDWLFYDHVASTFQPDVVLVVVFVGNDAIEANDREAWLDAGGPPQTGAREAAVTWVRRLVRSSMVLQIVRLRLDLLESRLTTPGPERPLNTYLAHPPPDVVHGLEVARRAFGLIVNKAAAAGARTGLVLMPARFQTDDADFGHLAETVRQAGGTLVRNAATDRFRAALAPLGVPMLDLLPVLAAQPDRQGLFFQRNVHLTPRGHRVVAGALFDFLETSGLAGIPRAGGAAGPVPRQP